MVFCGGLVQLAALVIFSRAQGPVGITVGYCLVRMSSEHSEPIQQKQLLLLARLFRVHIERVCVDNVGFIVSALKFKEV